MPGDVFDDHDGVIDDETRGDSQGHQREIVETVADQVHHAERPDQGKRDGYAGDQRGPVVSQEDENHQDDQDDGNYQCDFYFADGRADGGGAVDDHAEMDRRADGGLQLRHHGLHPIDGLDHVGARLAEDDQHDARTAVDEAGVVNVFKGVGDIADVGKADGRTVVPGDDERAVFVGFEKLIGVADTPRMF